MKDNQVNKLSMGARMLRASLSMRERSDTRENIDDTKRKRKEVFDFIDINDKKKSKVYRKTTSIDDREDDPNDDLCLLCGDGGGTLLCCDNCPSVFHMSCLNIKEVPSGDWNCCYCICKFCGLIDSNTNQAGGSTYAQSEPLDHTCRVCERKYHKSCLEANRAEVVHSNEALLCGNKCQEIFGRLQSLLGVKHEIEDALSWTFIRHVDFDHNDFDMKSGKVEWNVKISDALSLMNDSFGQCIDQRTKIDLIHGVLYNMGSKCNRLNFERFVTAILEKGDEVICAASIRIHENHVAEMPYIATKYIYRRQGICTLLLKGIESALKSLKVEVLVIPSLSEVKDMWTDIFGFEPLAPATKKKLNDIKILVLGGVEMLQKRIPSEK